MNPLIFTTHYINCLIYTAFFSCFFKSRYPAKKTLLLVMAYHLVNVAACDYLYNDYFFIKPFLNFLTVLLSYHLFFEGSLKKKIKIQFLSVAIAIFSEIIICAGMLFATGKAYYLETTMHYLFYGISNQIVSAILYILVLKKVHKLTLPHPAKLHLFGWLVLYFFLSICLLGFSYDNCLSDCSFHHSE